MMKRYNKEVPCPKCGAGKHSTIFCEGHWTRPKLFGPKVWKPEYIVRRCSYCDFREEFAPMDAKEVACERPDGTLNIHLESETCEVCREVHDSERV